MTLSPASSIWYKHGLEKHESLKTVEILTRKVINLIRLWCQFKSMLRLKYKPFILSQGLFYLTAWAWIPKNEIWIILSSFATVECKFPKVPLVFSPFVKTTAAQPWQSWIYIFFFSILIYSANRKWLICNSTGPLPTRANTKLHLDKIPLTGFHSLVKVY